MQRDYQKVAILFVTLFVLGMAVCIFVLAPRGVWPFGPVETRYAHTLIPAAVAGEMTPRPVYSTRPQPTDPRMADPAFAEAYTRGMHIYTNVIMPLDWSEYGGAYFDNEGWCNVWLLSDEHAPKVNQALRAYMHAIRLHENARYSKQALMVFQEQVYDLIQNDVAPGESGPNIRASSVDVVENVVRFAVMDVEKTKVIGEYIPEDSFIVEQYDDYLARMAELVASLERL